MGSSDVAEPVAQQIRGGGDARLAAAESVRSHPPGRSRPLVVISGCTSGIGRALFRGFARRGGWRVAGCGRRRGRLDELRAAVGGDHLVDAVDVASAGEVARWAAAVLAAHGRPPAIVIANAGVSPAEAKRDAWEVPPAALRATVETNLYGVANVARSFLPPMVGLGEGLFVAISSGSGRSTGASKSAYSASKFAVEAYTKCIAHSFAASHPRMVAVPLAPGTLRTELNPTARVTGPDRSGTPADEWAVDAVPFIIDLAARPELNGASVSVPNFYKESYRRSWIIRDGQPLVPEPSSKL